MVGTSPLPIEALKDAFLAAFAKGPVVLSAPPGSGKSTQVPRWLSGKVGVIEPRRVACRSLAKRVAELERCPLGSHVGYRVRDEHRSDASSNIVFMTPGIALRDLDVLKQADAIILDEFHERRLDVDLLLGLVSEHPGLVVMSATLEAERIATHLNATLIEGEGRVFPVDVRYQGTHQKQPHATDLAERVAQAIETLHPHDGDILVFLPGRGEIAGCKQRLQNAHHLRVLELHGGLSLKEQSRAFDPSDKTKVILSTNVAETSVTIPGITTVIDSGLVRRTRYHQGRAFLTLCSIAQDSAAQRSGRAGRTAHGHCIRLWGESCALEKRTPPEIHRESLVPMVLAAAAAGHRLTELKLLDAPKTYALEAAEEELTHLGAFDSTQGLTALGQELFSQPLDAPLARLLIEAKRSGQHLGDIIDLISVLASQRPLFPQPRKIEDEEDLRESGCDAIAFIRALRYGQTNTHKLSPFVLKEARRLSERLRRAHQLETRSDNGVIDRRSLAALIIRADRRAAHVTRTRRGHMSFSNGGTELELGNLSAVSGQSKPPDAILVLDTRAIGIGKRNTRIIATAVMPVPLLWLRDADLGRERIGGVTLKAGKVLATIERTYARRILETREENPKGAMATEAITHLVLQQRLLPKVAPIAKERLEARKLVARLATMGVKVAGQALPKPTEPIEELESFMRTRIEALGVESGEDANLISEEDLLPTDLDPTLRAALDRDYPREFEVGDARYEVDYDLKRRQVICKMVKGARQNAPPLGYLPRFPGFRICVESKRSMHVVRER